MLAATSKGFQDSFATITRISIAACMDKSFVASHAWTTVYVTSAIPTYKFYMCSNQCTYHILWLKRIRKMGRIIKYKNDKIHSRSGFLGPPPSQSSYHGTYCNLVESSRLFFLFWTITRFGWGFVWDCQASQASQILLGY